MIIAEIIKEIEFFAAPELQEDYDNSGMITGDIEKECTGVICALDVTMEVVHECISNGCNLIVSHHPIIFKGLKSITGKNYVEKIIIEAIKHNVAIYAAHTNMDNIILGVNYMISNKLNFKNTSILNPKGKILRRLITFAPTEFAEKIRNALFAAGAGHIGNYSDCSFNSEGIGSFKAGEGAEPYIGKIGEQHFEKETKIEIVYPFYMEEQIVQSLIKNHPYEEVAYDLFSMENRHLGFGSGIIGELENAETVEQFLLKLKNQFNLKVIKHTELIKKTIKKVAVCGGSGSFLIKSAISNKADIFITSDIKYHEFFDADGKIIIADIGHYESEQFTIDLFHSLLHKKFPTFAVLKTRVNTNPVKYFL